MCGREKVIVVWKVCVCERKGVGVAASTLQEAEQKGARSTVRGKSTWRFTFLRFIPACTQDHNRTVTQPITTAQGHRQESLCVSECVFKCL